MKRIFFAAVAALTIGAMAVFAAPVQAGGCGHGGYYSAGYGGGYGHHPYTSGYRTSYYHGSGYGNYGYSPRFNTGYRGYGYPGYYNGGFYNGYRGGVGLYGGGVSFGFGY